MCMFLLDNPDTGISPTLSTIFDPALIIKFMVISAFYLFLVMFVFPNRLILVPLSIIIISIKSDPSFVTCLIPCKLICNLLHRFCTGHTHIFVTFHGFSIPLFCCLLLMNVDISCPVKPIISCYYISDITII